MLLRCALCYVAPRRCVVAAVAMLLLLTFDARRAIAHAAPPRAVSALLL